MLHRSILVIFCILLTTRAFPYEIVLKNGSVVKGNLIRETKDSVLIKDNSGVIRNFKRSEIASTKAEKADLEKLNRPKTGRVATEEEIAALRKKYDLGLKSPGEFSWLPRESEEQDEYFEKDSEFEEEVLQANIPVLVEFWASWCGQPCHTMTPIIDSLAKEFVGQAKFYRINVDIRKAVTEHYGIEVIPMLLIFYKGEVQVQIVGTDSRETIARELQNQIKRMKS